VVVLVIVLLTLINLDGFAPANQWKGAVMAGASSCLVGDCGSATLFAS